MTKILAGTYRHDIIRLLEKPNGNIGVELGVAAGGFAGRMIRSGAFDTFIGVDMYADGHDIGEYKRAIKIIGLRSPHKLLRMTFDEALDLFDDDSLDFVYVDGYAHTGEEGGRTIYNWARKVKIGGVIAGDDYHSDWPLVVGAVDTFARDTGFELCLTSEVEVANYCKYPSWGMIKTRPVTMQAPADLVRLGRRGARRRSGIGAYVRLRMKRLAQRWLSDADFARLKRFVRR